MAPRLVHAVKAKMILASSKKTDKPDVHGLNRFQRTGTLPTVWIPDGTLRDTSELFRTRMVPSRRRTQIKNRIHAISAKYGIRIEDTSDVFNQKGRRMIEMSLNDLGPHTRFVARQMLSELDLVQEKIAAFGSRMADRTPYS